MEFNTWLLYISVISILLISPGPSAVLCVSDGLKFGHKRSIPTILGGAISALTLMSISAIGLGAVLAASETLFLVIKLIGAVYLIYLGWNAWREGAVKIENNEIKSSERGNLSRFKKGFMVGISNPKDLLFFIALFPNFINATLPPLEQYVVLAGTWFILDCTSMYLYVALGSKISPFLSQARNMLIVNRLVGSVFIFLGSALAISAGFSKKYIT